MSAIQFIDCGHSLDELVVHALARQPHLVGRRVRCQVQEQDVTLTGRVETYFQKQMAQESLRKINGIRRIVNDLEVVSR